MGTGTSKSRSPSPFSWVFATGAGQQKGLSALRIEAASG